MYILESTGLDHIPDAETNTIKFGVQLRKIQEVYGNFNGEIFYRKLKCKRDKNFYLKLDRAHSIVYNKYYDDNPLHWIRAKYKLEIGNLNEEKTFFCSALVSFIYVCLGFLPIDTKWSIIEPCQLGTEPNKNNLIFENCILEKEKPINI